MEQHSHKMAESRLCIQNVGLFMCNILLILAKLASLSNLAYSEGVDSVTVALIYLEFKAQNLVLQVLGCTVCGGY